MAECGLCSHDCLLEDGEVGKCKVRIGKNSTVVPLTYGMITTAIIDTIEQRPLLHYMPGSKCLAVGGFGCNMFCNYCQNFQISQTGHGESKYLSPNDLVDLGESKGASSIAFTYSEPLVWFEYVRDVFIASFLRTKLKTILKTNGLCSPFMFAKILELTHALNIDIKGDDAAYAEVCKVDSRAVKCVIGNVKQALQSKTHLECSVIVYPGHADRTIANLKGIAERVAGFENVPIHLLRFIPDFRMKDVVPTGLDELYKVQSNLGFKNVYIQFAGVDNHTSCKSCGTNLIGRNGTRILYNHLSEKCRNCGNDHGIKLCSTTSDA